MSAALTLESSVPDTVALVGALDQQLIELSRRGLIAPHQPCTGEEAVLVGSCAALRDTDWVFWGRQVLVPALMRGLPLARLFAHAHDMSAAAEIAALRVVATSHGAAARLPHAAGLAWAARKDGVVALCELGDGAVSDADFHVGVNFAGVLKAPVVFVVRSEEQECPVFERGEGYGVPGLRVPGDDPRTVRDAVAEAVERARKGGGPTLIEAMVDRERALPTSRLSAHEHTVAMALAQAERNRSAN